MAKPARFERIGYDTECERVLNTYFVSPLRRGYVRVNGVVMPDSYTKVAGKIRQMDIRDDDTFVCSYPKTGTTWTQEMVWCIGNDLDFKGAQTPLLERFPFLDLSASFSYGKVSEERPDLKIENFRTDSVEFVTKLKSPRFIKSHLPFDLLPEMLTNYSTKAKIVYVCRNPKDACISQFHYSQAWLGYSGNFDMFCELFLGDMLAYSPFWDHILKFWERREHRNLLFLTYEDMKQDLLSVIRKTAAFLGKSFNDAQLSSLLHHLSFESMKKNGAVNYESVKHHNRKCGVSGIEGVFMRSGALGGWKTDMTPDMIERFDAWTKEKTEGTAFAFST